MKSLYCLMPTKIGVMCWAFTMAAPPSSFRSLGTGTVSFLPTVFLYCVSHFYNENTSGCVVLSLRHTFCAAGLKIAVSELES